MNSACSVEYDKVSRAKPRRVDTANLSQQEACVLQHRLVNLSRIYQAMRTARSKTVEVGGSQPPLPPGEL